MKTPVLALTFVLVASVALPADEPAAVVRYRQSVMKAMTGHMNAMTLVVKKSVSQRGRMAMHAESVRGLSEGLAELFPAGTDADHVATGAAPAVWAHTADFAAAARLLQTESAKLATLAKSGDARGFDAQFEKVSAACNDCHHRFRQHD